MIFLFQQMLRLTAKDIPLDQTHNLTRHGDEETLIWIVWCVVATMLLSALLMALVIFIRRTWWAMTIKKEAYLRSRYENLLTEFICGDHENEMIRSLSSEKEALLSLSQKELRKSMNRRIFKECLLELHKHLSGQETNKLRDLYLILGFKHTAMQALKKSRSWEKLVESIAELSQLGIRDAKALIFPLVNHPNDMVSVAALRARVSLDLDPLLLLDDRKKDLSPWQKTQLRVVISRLPIEEMPDFRRWFHHPNATVVDFAKDMSDQFADSLLEDLTYEFGLINDP